MVAPETEHAEGRPRVVCSGPVAEAIEHASDVAVRLRPGEVAHDIDDGAVSGPPVLPGAIAREHKRRVLAALPMNDELDLPGG